MLCKLLTLIAFANCIMINAATTLDGMPDPYAALELGDAIKPLNLQLKDDAAQDVQSEFEAFRKAEQEKRQQVEEFKIVKQFAESLFNFHHSAPHTAGMHISFGAIEPWISNASDSSMPGTGADRVLIVNHELLAQILNVRSPRTVTATQIADHITSTRVDARNYERYQSLKYFAGTLPGIQPYEVNQLDQWFLDNNTVPPHGNTLPKLKCDLSVIVRLVKAKADRDISEEFEELVTQHAKLKERAQLTDDLEKFATIQGNGSLSTLMPGMALLDKQIFVNGSMMPRRVLADGADYISFLQRATKDSIQAMLANINAQHLRAYERFVLCSQGSGVEMYHADLQRESLVTFSGGFALQADGNRLTTNNIWALNHEGKLCVFTDAIQQKLGGMACHHSYFFQRDNVGLPIACAGHIEILNGKITQINNNSGHYHPSFLHLAMAVNYLHKQGVLADNIRFDGLTHPGGRRTVALHEVLQLARSIEFN